MSEASRRLFLQAIAAGLAMRHATAQGKATRVYWYLHGPPSTQETDAIRKSIAAAGHPEWRSVDISFHDADTADLRQAVTDRPVAIVVKGHYRLAELGRLTRQIPVVFYNLSLDPEILGVAQSLRRPGRNFTGTVIQWNEITTKYWQLLKDVRPWMKRGAVLADRAALPDAGELGDKILAQRRAALQHAARNLGIEIGEIVVPGSASASDIAEAVREARAEALEIGGPFTPAQLSLVARAGIPTAGFSFGAVRNGRLLIGISFDWDEGLHQAIAMVARILRGESPATMPVYQTRQYGVAVNLKMAREMGIEIPASILIQAVEVVR